MTLDPLLSLLLSVLWLIGIGYCTMKYVQAFRAKKRIEKWIWFILWCVFITFIEWVVYFAEGALCQTLKIACW